jgi:hypothetical protein
MGWRGFPDLRYVSRDPRFEGSGDSSRPRVMRRHVSALREWFDRDVSEFMGYLPKRQRLAHAPFLLRESTFTHYQVIKGQSGFLRVAATFIHHDYLRQAQAHPSTRTALLVGKLLPDDERGALQHAASKARGSCEERAGPTGST